MNDFFLAKMLTATGIGLQEAIDFSTIFYLINIFGIIFEERKIALIAIKRQFNCILT